MNHTPQTPVAPVAAHVGQAVRFFGASWVQIRDQSATITQVHGPDHVSVKLADGQDVVCTYTQDPTTVGHEVNRCAPV